MGGIFSCFHEYLNSSKPAADEQRKSSGQQDATFVASAAAAAAAVIASDKKWEKGRPARAVEDALIEEAATLILLQQQQQQQRQNGGGRPEIPFDRSASLKYPGMGVRKPQGMRRSSSSRLRSPADAVVPPEHLLNQGCEWREHRRVVTPL
ncbi:hypothetical protein KSP39_PZI005023 [Platanthera zijinensis]|uniref:Uncharacterized protein n=1 Tax=Platanthera zijinensis TaxID=2320716 RepID=A0AAP0GBF4_9ASPA